jgi:hypothetical protein
MEFWFDEGVDHRTTGKSGSGQKWQRKPLRLKLAIVLAANALRVDAWELLTEESRQNFLARADRLLTEGAVLAVRRGQGAVAVDLVGG